MISLGWEGRSCSYDAAGWIFGVLPRLSLETSLQMWTYLSHKTKSFI